MGVIAAVGLEDGTLDGPDGFTSTVTDGGKLSVETPGLAGTAFGLQVLIDDATNKYGNADFTALGSSPTACRVRTHFDPHSLTMAHDDKFVLLQLREAASAVLFTMDLTFKTQFQHRLVFQARDDGGSAGSATVNITDEPHYIEAHLAKASTDSALDGETKVYIDGNLVYTESNLDLFDFFELIDRVQVGAIFGLDAGTSGIFFMDQLIVRDDSTEIGEHVPISMIGPGMMMGVGT